MISNRSGHTLEPKPDVRRILIAAVVAPLSVFVILPPGLLYRWWADGPRFEPMSSLHTMAVLAAAFALPALFITLAIGVPLYLVALRRNIASIWLAAAAGFICPWTYYLGRYALIEAASPRYRAMTFPRYLLELTQTMVDAKFLLVPLSLFGMLVGIVFWFVAPRPIRTHTPGKL